MSVLSPKLWLAFIGVAALALIVGFGAGHHYASQVATAREASITEQASTKLAEATAKTVTVERTLRAEIDGITARHHQEKTDEKAKADRTIADLRNRLNRLSIPVASCGATGPADSAATPGTGNQARAELTGPAAEFLVGLASECDASAIQLNAVIDAYEKARTTINQGAQQ